jgi:paraquat-inducible protein A
VQGNSQQANSRENSKHKALKQIACHDCDLLISVPEMEENQTLICPVCSSKQFTKHKGSLDTSISYGLAALILLLMANAFPFLSFETQGQVRTITLLQASYDLYLEGFVFLAMLVYAFVLLLPLLYLSFLLLLLIPIKLGLKPFFKVYLGRLLGLFLPWIMAEVFIVGVLVALIKVIELADIIVGFSFWAYVGFAILFTLTSNIANRHQLWSWIEDAKG